MRDQRRLGAHMIDRVDHRVAGRDQGKQVAFVDEFLHGIDHAGRVDRRDTLPHGHHLGGAERRVQRLDLAVDVGFRDVIEIDQRQFPDA